jgi:hypothetical protein
MQIFITMKLYGYFITMKLYGDFYYSEALR